MSTGEFETGEQVTFDSAQIMPRRRAQKILRLTILTGLAGSAALLLGVLGAQSATASTIPGTSSNVSDGGQQRPGASLLNSTGKLVKGTVGTLGSILSPVTSALPATTAQLAPSTSAPAAPVTSTPKLPNVVGLVKQTVQSSVQAVAPKLSLPVSAPSIPELLAPVKQTVNEVLTPVVAVVTPVATAAQPIVNGTVTTVTGQVHQTVKAVEPPASQLPVVGVAVPPVVDAVDSVLDHLTPVISLPGTGLPGTTVPGIGDLPGIGPLPGIGSSPGIGTVPSQLPGVLPLPAAVSGAQTTEAGKAAKVQGNAGTSQNAASPPGGEADGLANTAGLGDLLAFAALNVPEPATSTAPSGGAAPPGSPVAPSPGLPSPPAPSTSSTGGTSGSAGSPNGALAVLSGVFKLPANELSGLVGLPSQHAPSALAHDPGSSPD